MIRRADLCRAARRIVLFSSFEGHGGIRSERLRTGTGFLTHTRPTDIRQHRQSIAACMADLQRAQLAVNHLQSTSAPHAPTTGRAQSRPPRTQALRPAPHNPGIDERSRRDALEDVRDAHGIEEVLAQGPAKGQAECQQRGGANSKGQGGYNTAA